MAYAALVFLDQELQKILHNRQYCVHLDGKEGLESLYSNVIFLEKFLEDFSGNSSSMIKKLESQITDVAYEMSDIIARGITYSWRYKRKIKSCIREVSFRVEDAKEMRKVLEMKTNILGHDSWITSSSSTVAVPSDNNTMVGLGMDLSQMKERIFGRNSTLQIIPITGMGGIGKTTLARSIYKDPAIVAHFDVRFWVTFSQEYNVHNILQEILGEKPVDLESLVEEVHEKLTFSQEYNAHNILKEILGEKPVDLESLVVDVHKKLYGRRYLVVMDDIWNVEAWDKVRNAFPDGNKGSRIIITTRLSEVATKIGLSSPLHQIQLMNEGQSWELFHKEAFGNEYCPPQLENIGKSILRSCKGLPLAIVVVARLLKPNRTIDYWEEFLRNVNEAMAEATQENQLIAILSLSYDDLLPHLKACFLYMSCMFPENAVIPIKKLKMLWVAEGFLKPARDRSMDEVAEKCLVDLVERNLLFVDTWRSIGRIRTCTIHDILRELSLRKAKEDKFSQQIIARDKFINFTKTYFRKHMPGFKDKISSTSQLSVIRRCIGTPAIFRGDNINIRYVYSLIIYDPVDDEDLPLTIRSNLLRVLDVRKISLRCLPQHGVNLRYLAFTYFVARNAFTADNDDDLFANIRKLKNLETLIIRNKKKFNIKYFPILDMPKLKHFVVQALSNYYCLIDNHNRAMSTSVSNKSPLQTLSGVDNLELTTDAIEIFANLVKLKIGCDRIDHAYINKLACLHQLEELTLIGDITILPTNITFPDKLKKITLRVFTISWKTMSVIGSLPNLQVLKVLDCIFESLEWEPVEGEFQQLKYLKLRVRNLEEWKVESTHFPCLEHLILNECLGLKEVPAEVGEIDSLQKLDIAYCNKHMEDSARKMQMEQQRRGNYGLQVLISNQTSDSLMGIEYGT